MALKHFWYSLKDNYGVPLSGVSVNIYKNGTSNELDIFDSSATQLSQPLTTDSDGIFEFYVKDIHSGGYLPSQKMKIVWDTGVVDDLDIFAQMYPVDETDSSDTTKNKLVSNQEVYNWETHSSLSVSAGGEPHTLTALNVLDSVSTENNKVVSNKFLNDLLTTAASAGTITISASGAVLVSFSIDVKGGTSPCWLDTLVPSAGDYYITLNHGLGTKYPLLSVWKTSNKKMIVPSTIEGIDINNTQIWVNEDEEMEISIVS